VRHSLHSKEAPNSARALGLVAIPSMNDIIAWSPQPVNGARGELALQDAPCVHATQLPISVRGKECCTGQVERAEQGDGALAPSGQARRHPARHRGCGAGSVDSDRGVIIRTLTCGSAARCAVNGEDGA
jgi:hypothetical protein